MRLKSLMPGLWLLAISVLIASYPAMALNPDKPIREYGHNQWTLQDGLPQSSVLAILQTRDGYLRLGTFAGLARFDGVRFTIKDRSNSGLPHNSVMALLEARDSSLWIGTDGGGLIRYRDGKYLTIDSRHGLHNPFVREIVENPDGSLWVATGTGVYHVKLSPKLLVSRLKGIPTTSIRGLCVGTDGSLWIASKGRGLLRYLDGKLTSYDEKNGLPDPTVMAVYCDRAGRIWAGTRKGLVSFWQGKFTVYDHRAGVPSADVMDILEDRHGNLWVGTHGDGLFRLRQGRVERYTVGEGLLSNVVRTLYEDREGSLWVGTHGGGLDRFKDWIFSTISVKNGLRNGFIQSLFQASDGAMWIGTNGGGLSVYRGGVVHTIDKADGLVSNGIWPIYGEPDGTMWAGFSEGGLARIRKGRVELFDRVGDRLVRLPGQKTTYQLPVSAIYVDPAGQMWIGSSELYRVDRTGRDGYRLVPQGVSRTISSIFRDSHGALWIGSRRGIVVRIQNGRQEVFGPKTGLPDADILPIFEDSDGIIWFGSLGGGLVRYDDGQFHVFNTADGLHNNYILQIQEDRKGNLWLGTRRGIFQVRKNDLKEHTRHDSGMIRPVVYGIQDGMQALECTWHFSPNSWRANDGKLWFATVQGAVVIDPEIGHKNQASPPVHIERIVADGTGFPDPISIQVRPGAGNLSVKYTGLSLLAPERVRFRYRLEGYDRKWIDAGVRRQATYTNLPPGTYRFQVIAANNDGLWNRAGATATIHLQPHVYERFEFRALALVLLVGLIFWGVRHRERRLKRKNQALEQLVANRTEQYRQAKEAAESATEAKSQFLAVMSHEVRTPLHGLLGVTELLQRTPLDEEQKEYADSVHRSANTLLTVVNSVLDLSKLEAGKLELDPKPFDLRQVVTDTATLYRSRATIKGLYLETMIADDLPQQVVGDGFRLQQVLGNLVMNAIKFTHKGGITIRVSPDVHSVRFEVIDTGVGIESATASRLFTAFAQADASTARKFGGTGLGLSISKQLVEVMDGSIGFEPGAGGGSTFWFVLALPAA